MKAKSVRKPYNCKHILENISQAKYSLGHTPFVIKENRWTLQLLKQTKNLSGKLPPLSRMIPCPHPRLFTHENYQVVNSLVDYTLLALASRFKSKKSQHISREAYPWLFTEVGGCCQLIIGVGTMFLKKAYYFMGCLWGTFNFVRGCPGIILVSAVSQQQQRVQYDY